MGNWIVCKYCGKEYDADLPKCPSCGSTNVKGAEKEYLNKLEDIRENMEDLEEVPQEELLRTIKSQGRSIKRILLVVAVVALAAVGGIWWSEKSSERDYKAEYLWKQENYPKLDALYDAGEYDALAELYFVLLEEENSIAYEWEHYDFLNAYLDCISAESYLDEEGELSVNALTSLFNYEWSIKGLQHRKEAFTEEEYAALQPFIERCEADFESRWGMEPGVYDTFYKMLEENGYRFIRFEECEKYVEEWAKENR